MRDEHMVICSPAVFELVSPDSAPVPVKVELTYDSRDPYAVQASFRTGQGTAVDWVFARDLLADGLMARRARGTSACSRCPPTRPASSRAELAVRARAVHDLRADPGRVPRPDLEAVPPSTEYSWLDFDHALSELLANDRARD